MYNDAVGNAAARKAGGIAAAKVSLAPSHPPSDWTKNDGTESIQIEHEPGSSTVSLSNGSIFTDSVPRYSVTDFEPHGDNLPLVPAVITGCCDNWASFEDERKESCWTVPNLAKRLSPETRLSLDGGPYFARMSMNSGRVTMSEYEQYANDNSDSAPLYLFDPDVLTSTFHNGDAVKDDYTIPSCFALDVMDGLTGSRFRPLPPAWLLVGVERSGTPIHDHPFFVAWNALLSGGCKLWCCFPPDVDESVLLLNDGCCEEDELKEDDDDDFEFDTSALQWFSKCCTEGRSLPDCAKIIVQQPGEVAYVPPGWWHIVLNVGDAATVAICYSLVLRRDVPRLFPPLLESDEDFAKSWLESMATADCNSSMDDAVLADLVAQVSEIDK